MARENVFDGRGMSGQAEEALTKWRFGNFAGSLANDLRFSMADNAEQAEGIFPQTYASGIRDCTMYVDGLGWVEADGSGTAIVVGSELMPNASGIAVVATATNPYSARAMKATTAASEVIPVRIVSGLVTP